MSNTSAQFFLIVWGISQQKYVHSESQFNSSFVYDENETSKEVLAGLKMMLIFSSQAISPSQFYFFRCK